MLNQVSAREIAVSGLKAQRLRMNVIANNIANAQTTRTPEGGAFRRQMVMLRAGADGMNDARELAGVKAARIQEDRTPFERVFDPGHPDADAQGFVAYPNVNMAVEMVDLAVAQRAYEANIAVLQSGSRMRERAMMIMEK